MNKPVVAGFSLMLACAATGCVVEASTTGTSTAVPVTGPPPRPMEERRPPAPLGTTVWVAGYWHWTGMQYTWIPGHWESAPAGSQWRAPHYSVRDGAYFYEPGSWTGR